MRSVRRFRSTEGGHRQTTGVPSVGGSLLPPWCGLCLSGYDTVRCRRIAKRDGQVSPFTFAVKRLRFLRKNRDRRPAIPCVTATSPLALHLPRGPDGVPLFRRGQCRCAAEEVFVKRRLAASSTCALFIVALCSSDASAQWVSTNGPAGAQTNAFTLSNGGTSLLAATGGGGVFRANSTYTNWTRVNNGLTHDQRPLPGHRRQRVWLRDAPGGNPGRRCLRVLAQRSQLGRRKLVRMERRLDKRRRPGQCRCS